jgi:hypothetical protein
VDRLLGALAEIAGSAKPAAVANVGASSG